MPVVRVLVTSPVEKAYDYLVPEGMALAVGDYVTVPLGSRSIAGVVWEIPANSDVPPAKLKSVLERHDLPPMPAVSRHFIDWVANYNMAARGAVLKMAVSVQDALTPPTPLTGYICGTVPEGGMDEGQQKIIEVLADGLPRRAAELQKVTGVSPARLKTMVKNNLLRAVDIFAKAPCHRPDPDKHVAQLTPEQKAAADIIDTRIKGGGYETFLLDGVTGSGKTEVYFESIAATLRKGKQILILMPEIALTTSFIGRFATRFGCTPALWHSSLTPAQRRLTWRSIASGDTKVVVGARSGLFLPTSQFLFFQT